MFPSIFYFEGENKNDFPYIKHNLNKKSPLLTKEHKLIWKKMKKDGTFRLKKEHVKRTRERDA